MIISKILLLSMVSDCYTLAQLQRHEKQNEGRYWQMKLLFWG